MKTAHIFNFSVAFADTDLQGIMYHGRYVEVAERARTNWSKDIVVPDDDFGFIIRELNIKYKSPLKLGDDFIVETQPIKIGAASMVVEQKFVKGETICAIMNITIAYLGSDMRPMAIPETIINALT
ncbi:MAG: acyl-CoA thioesterase [Alphaproteobacteria bacterium]|nr:acyl-CoA thioesterase [Alphaproteobacteria bacterium]